MAAAEAEGEKKGAMAPEKGEKELMAAEKGAPVEEKGKGEEGAVASEEENGGAEAKGKEVAGVKMITVESLDGEKRSISVAAMELWVIFKGMFEDGFGNEVIPLENVATGRTLDLVIEYCTKHAAEPVKSDCDPSAAAGSSSVGAVNTAASKEWDRKFVEDLSADDLLIAANYLHIEGLLDLACEKAADMIKGKTTQQIRHIFNLPDDLTPADVAELSQQFAWGFCD